MQKEKEIHFSDYLRVIWNRKGIVVTTFLLTLIVVSIATFTATPIYRASTQILVEKSDPPLLNGRSFVKRYEPQFFQTQSQIIKSQNVTKKVVEILELETNYETYFPAGKSKPSLVKATVTYIKSFIAGLLPSGSAGKGQEASASTDEEQTKLTADSLATIIKKNVVVKPVADSSLLDIHYKSENPEFAKLIANTLPQAYTEEIMAINLNSSGYAIRGMTKKEDIEKNSLAQSEKALQAFMKENDIITVENRIAIIPQKLADLSKRMTEAEAKREEQEALLNQIAELKKNKINADTIPILAKNNVLQSLRDQILKSEQHITELSQKYGDKHPVMIRARADLKNLQRKKYQETEKSIQVIKNEYDLAHKNELNVKKLLNQTKNEVLDLNEKFIQYGILKREVDANRALFDTLNLRIKEQGVTEYTQQVNVWVTEQAGLPEFPVSPKKMRNMILGVILGLLGGVGLAFFLEYFATAAKEPN
ncbi:GumC family protein [Desulfogranum marinum]|uniref:GumC family protein n=1 Tax=Desulfogranum marinum TaxID=453220 RepID=UPI0019640C7C|nr:GumC family protein [Desulfogranum marinum]MBM9514825.1 GumC family protein [Desulfogranum marinum]